MIRRLLGRWWMRWLVLPLLALFAAHGIWTLVLKWEFERRIEELRTSGAPADLRDLARPRAPEEDNAAALLRQQTGAWPESLDALIPLRADDEIVWRLPPPW
ncbi:MAG: hypothetical protein ACHQ1G_06125 [Planctomycetota bacterium]